jgi:uncharacterized membrane protein
MFEPMRNAAWKARLVNGFILFFIFATWVSTMNAFGNVLHTDDQVFQQGASSLRGKVDVYWHKYRVFGQEYGFRDELLLDIDGDGISAVYNPFNTLGPCVGAGRGWVAMNVFCFLVTIPLLIMTFGRLSGLGFPGIRDIHHSLKVELYLCGAVMFFLFLSVAIWGWACLATFSEVAGSSIVGVGFGYTVACMIFMMITTFVLYVMQSDSSLQVGEGVRNDSYDRSSSSRSTVPQSDVYDASADVEQAFTYETSEPEHLSQNAL